MSELRLNAGAAAGALAPREYHLAHEPHPENGTALGFWLYLMSDCLIFAALFATYGVLGRSYAAGPTGAELFDLPARFPDAEWSLAMTEWHSNLSAGFVRLDPRLSPDGPYDRRWRLRVNVPRERLAAWMET